MKRIIFAVVLGVLCVSAGGWWYFNRGANTAAAPTASDQASVPQKESSVPGVVTGSTSPQWQTYTNQQHHYSIEIPAQWKIVDTKGVFVGIPGEVGFFPHPERDGMGVPGVYITVSSGGVPRYGLDTEEEYQEWLAAPITLDTSKRQYKIDTLTIMGIQAVQYVSQTIPGDAGEPFYSVITWFRAHGKNYNIEFTYPVGEELKVYNTVVSRFRFNI